MPNGLSELARDCECRVEARLGVLGDVGESAAPKTVELAFRHTKDVATFPQDATPGRLEPIGQKAKKSKRGYALAAAGLANQADRFSIPDIKTHSGDDGSSAAAIPQHNFKIAHNDQPVRSSIPMVYLGRRQGGARAKSWSSWSCSDVVNHRDVPDGITKQPKCKDRKRDQG